MPQETAVPYPEGIAAAHARPRRFGHPWASVLALLLLGGLLAAALGGLLGGTRATTTRAATSAAALSVTMPRTLRNGLFFEMRIVATARRDIADATIAVPPALWRDMTINSQIPAASEESFGNGTFRFRYGPLRAGERLVVKIDGQINPPLFAGTRGDVALLDGEAPVVAVPLSLTVLP